MEVTPYFMLEQAFPGFRIIAIEETGDAVRLTIESGVDTRPCPKCGCDSSSEHSRYTRRPRDLPIQGRVVTLQAIVRRFHCHNPACDTCTFAESLGVLAPRHAQRTSRLTKLLQNLIVSVSSPTGARLAAQMGIRTSARTLLRVIDDLPVSTSAPRVLGIDDFALRRGHTYGTILCDLEKGRPIDILYGRKAQPLVEWLKKHPGVEVVARDRASAYADAARTGAPDAVQVADRFHLVKNVGDALREVLDHKRWTVPVLTPEEANVASDCVPSPPTPIPDAPASIRQNPVVTERRRELHAELLRRRANGESLRTISEVTGASVSTLKRYLRMADGPQPTVRRRQRRNTDTLLDYLRQRWVEGCRNGRHLFAEAVERGYEGSVQSLRRVLTEWRRCEAPRPSAKANKETTLPPAPTWKDLRWYVLAPPEHLRAEQVHHLDQFLALHPELDRAYRLAQTFRRMLKEKCTGRLDDWVAAAASSDLAPFQRLARTLQADRQAVLAGIRLPWSTGPVEGHINRLKLLKRLGYGRAGIALLRARVIGTA